MTNDRKTRIDRYQVLVDRKLAGVLSEADTGELAGLQQSFDLDGAPGTQALLAELERENSVFAKKQDALRSKMRQFGIELPDAPDLSRTQSAKAE